MIQLRAKRVFDLVAITGGLVVFTPVFAMIALAITYDDADPWLFRQQRLGRGRVPFTIYKWRTMRGGEITAPGRWLRATGLDETAQFFNVLRGEMSLVGPRPLTAADVERLCWDRPEHDDRFVPTPGITGLAQVHGGSNSDAARALDREWAANWSVWGDARLVARSFAMNLLGKERIRRWVPLAAR